MPTYEYECCRCGERIELIQRVSDPPLKKCGKCGAKVRKLMFPVGVIYKGSGFYTTDYARKGSSFSDGGNGGKSSKPDSKQDEPAKADSNKAESPK